ncbi:MAG: phosphoadenosine phosphosulfate reductase family protein [Nitrospira sp.]|nr:phosphoadenosine phosphosulfate reductase family protein [Nitrospira sp.]
MNHTRRGNICCTALKTMALESLIEESGYSGIIRDVRAHEDSTGAKERYYSPRDKHGDWDFRDRPPELWDQFTRTFPPGTHVRIHPLLDWTEIDMWEYIKAENIPFIDRYLDRGNGTRYRSLERAPCTAPVRSTAKTVDEIVQELRATSVAERTGGAQGAGCGMEMLRKRGYLEWAT